MKTAPPTHKEPHAMKQIICGAFALLALAATAHAEPQIPEGIFLKAQTADEYLAKDHLIGMKVKGPDGKIIGDIEDLIISDGNQVVGIVMGTGGFLGLGEKRVGVALQSLKFEENGGQISVALPEATAEVLAAVPAYERAQPKKSLLERAKEKARELSDKTAATTKDAVERAKPALDEAKQKAQEAYEKAKEAVAPTIEKAKEAVQEAVDAAKDAAKPDAPAPNGATTPPAAEPAPAPAAPTTP
jgi:flagellar biosynthesis GTPase FlhF